jgi:hypothetical protein
MKANSVEKPLVLPVTWNTQDFTLSADHLEAMWKSVQVIQLPQKKKKKKFTLEQNMHVNNVGKPSIGLVIFEDM